MKKTICIFLFILSCLFFFVGTKSTSAKVINCQGWTHPTETCPSISSVLPEIATINDTIIITGSNFEQEQGLNKISFWYDDNNYGASTYDATGQIISWSDNEIKYRPVIGWDTHPNAQKNRYICIKKCNNINGCDENCFSGTINIKYPCSSYIYSSWLICSESGQQTRTVISSVPDNCGGGASPVLSQSCIYTPPCIESNWSCTDWSLCLSNEKQARTCNKTSNCQGGVFLPTISQSCVYTPPYIPPACQADTWQCGDWGICSPQGIQTRSCNKTYDCSSIETAAPATSQYCEAPNQPKQQTPSEDLGISNQDTIVRATVKLVCPVSNTMASQGSGTVIGSTGLILTNKHVIDGTLGCLVGFIDDYDDEPYFGDRQIADIYKISNDADVAVLKLRNPSNKILTTVNISQSNSSSIKLGEILTTYGYPAKFGTKITYTSGDFSGVDGSYLKTTAVIEHGNSGGGAYLKNGTFIGIPTAVIKGSLNSMGYLLSVDKVNSWLSNSVAYNSDINNNNYSRVSAILENMDLITISSLGLFIPGDETNTNSSSDGSYSKILDNNFIKIEGFPAVYWLSADNKRYLFSNRNVFGSWFGDDFSGLRVISQNELNDFQTGGNLTIKPGNYLKFDNSDIIYYVQENNNICKDSDKTKSTYLIQSAFEADYEVTGNCQ